MHSIICALQELVAGSRLVRMFLDQQNRVLPMIGQNPPKVADSANNQIAVFSVSPGEVVDLHFTGAVHGGGVKGTIRDTTAAQTNEGVPTTNDPRFPAGIYAGYVVPMGCQQIAFCAASGTVSCWVVRTPKAQDGPKDT